MNYSPHNKIETSCYMENSYMMSEEAGNEVDKKFSVKTREQLNKIIGKYETVVNEYKAKLYNKTNELEKCKKVNEEYEKIVTSSKSFIEELYEKNKMLKEKLMKYKYRE